MVEVLTHSDNYHSYVTHGLVPWVQGGSRNILPGLNAICIQDRPEDDMIDAELRQRLRLQIDLALRGNTVSSETRRSQDRAGRALGMTGAEIDAARDGRCFDIRLARALAVTDALRSGDPARLALARALAQESGFDRADLAVIEQLTEK
jgi:hypothetical protein